jgi:hypothetical protein
LIAGVKLKSKMKCFLFLPALLAATYGGDVVVMIGGGGDCWADGKTETFPRNGLEVRVDDILPINGGAAVMNGILYFCGGRLQSDQVVRKTCYKNVDGRRRRWVELEAKMNFARQHFTMTILNGNILVMGGQSSNKLEDYMDTIEVYDGTTWKLIPGTLTSQRSKHCTVTVSESSVYLIGGLAQGFDRRTMERYTLQGKKPAARLENMPEGRNGHACALFGGDIWVAGGWSTYDYTDSVVIYNLDSQTWRAGPSMNKVRAYATMEVVNGVLMVFGDQTYGRNAATRKTYEKLVNGEWILGDLDSVHRGHASAILTGSASPEPCTGVQQP